jgi:hypothetical protein
MTTPPLSAASLSGYCSMMSGAARTVLTGHTTFWADDLVYTSSSGERFGKADIMSGFDETDKEESAEPAVAYTGEGVKVQLFGTTAVVTFQ